jgi:carboxypeptidase Taq
VTGTDRQLAWSFTPLLTRMQELRDLQGAIGLLTWDQETFLPHKAEPARGAQLSTLQGLYHERLTSPALGELLAEADRAADLTSDQRAMVRVLRWERDRAVKVPGDLVRAIAEAQSHGLSAWRAARKAKDFRLFQAALETMLHLRRQQADAMGHGGQRYDALLEGYEPGMRVERLRPVLLSLERRLVPLVRTLAEAARRREDPRAPLAGKRFARQAQIAFTMDLLRAMGFDLEAGRQDESIHPFTGGTHPRDVRLTTLVDESNPLRALFGTIHEGGHGLYEQGFSEEHHRTPLAAAPSMGLHESQSRLWENVVGRSRGFWSHFYPALQAALPGALGDVTVEQFYAAANDVRPSLVRVEADEITYNLHILLRFELELVLISGELPVADLPAEWNARLERLLGLRPPDDLQGVLQDIHWATGDFGYFPTYTLGNLYSAQLWDAARRAVPDLEDQVRRGHLLGLLEWLREHVHRQGFRYPAEELIQRVTGQGLNEESFLRYLREKYSELYGVSVDV